MSPEFIAKWEHILEDVEKQKIPVQFIKKIIVKLEGKRQQTINIEKFLSQGLDPEQIEDAVGRKLHELDDQISSVEFVLNVQNIAETVQPETDRLLNQQIALE
jgi:predicted metal-dependent TIM-barrel fold hydrolase